MLPNLGFGELVVILAILLLLFGAKRLPDVARGIGSSLRAFKEGMREGVEESDKPSKSAISADSKEKPTSV